MLRYEHWETGNERNWYGDDPLLQRYAKRYLSAAMYAYVEPRLLAVGALAAGPIDRRAAHTDRDGAPKLIRYDRQGREINEVWYNEGYRQTVQDGYGAGVVGLRYMEGAPERVPFLANSLLFYLLSEAETGFTCPVALTQSVAFVVEKFGSEEQKRTYLPRLAGMDGTAFWQGGTFLTEIQGGSDVGATLTVAVREGDHYRLTGEKWFASNCDADVAITLARVNDRGATAGLGLFLVPRTLPDGTRNAVSIRRLKDKLGVRAVASGELELNGAVGYLIGEEDQGFKYMAEALNVSRIDTALGGVAIAQRAFREAAIYTAQRSAFGQVVQRYPMVQETLYDMMTEIEAAWAVCVRTMGLFDQVHTEGTGGKAEYAVLRVLLSLAKYRCSELGVSAAKRSLELHGGNGYIEEYVTARLLRDAVVNPVWEGTANIQALEVLKTLLKGGHDPFVAHLHAALGAVRHPAVLALRQVLAVELSRAETLIQATLTSDNRRQAALAKKLTDFLYDLYAGIRLLEEAQYDLNQTGDGRRLLIAEHWTRLSFDRSPDRGILDAYEITDEKFTAVVAFEAWPVAVGTREV